MGEFVRLEVTERVGVIKLDRPPMNALSFQVQDELTEAATEAAHRADVRAVVLYGGRKVFAAGADVKEMADKPYTAIVDRVPDLHRFVDAIAAIPKPVIAAVTGYALGGGLELALAADFRVCAEDARLGLPEIQLGIIPGAGGTQRLPRLIGAAKAKDLIFSGRHVRADEALALGLVDKVVPGDDVEQAALSWAATFTGGPAYALRAAKEAIDRGLQGPLFAGMAVERAVFAGLFATRDRTIGMESFVEKGPGKADFVGE